MVSKRAEQRDPAYDLSVRDHLVLSGISCRLQKRSVIGADRPNPLPPPASQPEPPGS